MSDRLTIALDQDLLSLPAGTGILNAPADMALPAAMACQSFFPIYEALKSRGLSVSPTPEGPFQAAVVQCHRARAMTYHLLWHAVRQTIPGGLVAINGDKTDGVEAILREVKKHFPVEDVFSKAHGKLAWFQRPSNLPDIDHWKAEPFDIEDGFQSFPGIFSSNGPDRGSQILLEHLPNLKGRGLDLGAGWGYLSRAILASQDITHLDLIEADYHAAEAAKANVTDPRASVVWGDALTFEGAFDFIVSNPPFHTGRKPDATLGQAFIAKASQLLRPRGQFWMVANRQLPYEETLSDHFHHVETRVQTGGYKVVFARKPKNARG